MAYEQIKMTDLVNRAVEHQWSIPEFQRGFVWRPTQVRDLAESLWLNYPIGSLLVWNSYGQVEERVAIDAQRPTNWLVDGQQRTTALCILFGRKPYWWNSSEDWNKTLKRYDIRFDVETKEPPFFWVANVAIRNTRVRRYIPLCKLLTLDTQKEQDQRILSELSREIKMQGLCNGMDAMEVYTRLDRVRKIREKDMVTVTVDHELEDVVEIFSRLNSRGTRVTEADIYLGIVAARNPKWVRDEFLPYRNSLADLGFDIDPNLLFRSLTGIGERHTRFKDIPDAFWNPDRILPAWDRTKEAWRRLIVRFREYGVLTNEIMPTQAAIVTMLSLVDKFRDDERFRLAFYWFLQASRFGRYSGSGATALDEDLRDIQAADDFQDAIQRMLKRFRHEDPIDSEEFMREYSDTRFGRFLLYLLVYKNKAQDWDEHSQRLGFDGAEILAKFCPQWHHIFPRKHLEGHVPDDLIDKLANIAVIGPSINIRISNRSPLDYVSRYRITEQKLQQQYIDPKFIEVPFDSYAAWLHERATNMVRVATEYLGELKGGLV